MAGKTRGRRVRRVVLVGLLAVVLLLGLGVALLPTIAGGFVRSAIASGGSGAIAGDVGVDRVELRWFGPLRVRGVRLTEPDGSVVANLSMETSKGLAGLVLSGMDLGELRLSGEVTVRVDAEGRNSFDRAIGTTASAPAPTPRAPTTTPTPPTTTPGTTPAPTGTPPKGEPVEVRLPAGLRAALVLDGLRVRYDDPALHEVTGGELEGLSVEIRRGRVAMGVGEKASLFFDGAINGRGSGSAWEGRWRIEGEAEGWSEADGLVVTDPARLVVQLSMTLETPDVSLDGAFALRNGLLRAERALVVSAPESAPVLVPALRASGLEVDRLAGVDVRVDALEVRLDRVGDVAAHAAAALSGASEAVAPSDLGPSVRVRANAALGDLSLRLASEDETSEGGARWTRLELSGASVSIDAGGDQGVGGDVRLVARAGGAVDGHALGDVRVNATARGLMSSSPVLELLAEAPRATPAAALVLSGMGVDAAALLGPGAALRLTATAGGSEEEPNLAARLDVTGERLRIAVPLVFERGVLRSGAQPTTVYAEGLDALRPLLAELDLPIEFQRAGVLDVRVTGLRLPISAEHGADLGSLTLSADVILREGTIAGVEGGALEALGEVGVSLARVSFAAKGGEGVETRLRLSTTRAGETIESVVELSAPGALTALQSMLSEAHELDPLALGARGKVQVSNVPKALVAALLPAQAMNEDGTPGPDLPAAWLAAAGERSHVTFEFGPNEHAPLVFTGRAWSGAHQVTIGGSVRADAFELAGLEARTAMDDRTVQAVAAALGVERGTIPTLQEPMSARVTLHALRIPLSEGLEPAPGALEAAVLDASGELTAALRDVVLPAAEEGAAATSLGPIAVRPARFTVRVPLAAVLAPAEDASPGETVDVLVRVEGDVRYAGAGDAPGRLVRTTVHASAPVRTGEPAGAVSLWGTFEELDLGWVEHRFAEAGAITGPMGPALFGEFAYDGDPSELARLLAGEAGASPSEIGVRVYSMNLHAQERVRLRFEAATESLPPRVTLIEPVTLPYVLPVEYGSTLLGENGRLVEPVHASVRLEQLTVAVPGHKQGLPGVAYGMAHDVGGALVYGVFAVRGELLAPSASVDLGDRGIVSLRDVRVGLRELSGTFQQTLLVGVAGELTATPEKDGVRSEAITGSIAAMIADAYGHPIEHPVVTNLDLNMRRVPTALVDALAQQNGLLVDILGNEVTASVRALNLRAPDEALEGYIEVKAESPRARAEVRGQIGDQVLALSSMEVLRISEVSPALAGRFTTGLPLVSGFEKRPSDEPATVTVTNLRLPLDGNLANLSGVITIDPGIGRVFMGELFSSLLRLEREHAVGRGLPALRLSADAGVVSYDTFVLPLGEFRFESSGRVDLVRQQVDVTTWVPLGALTEETAGAFNTSLTSRLGGTLGGLSRETMMPFRTRGSLTNPSTAPDVETFIQTAPDRLGPEVLERGLQRLLEGNTGREIERGLRDLLRPRRDDDK